MSVLTARLMNVSITNFQFVFSPDALGKTVLYFGVIFLFVLIFNTVSVGKQQLINLMYATRKNQWFKTPPLPVSLIAFAGALVCLFIAYRTALTSDVFRYLDIGVIAGIILLSVAGTFLFFFSLSSLFMKLAPRNKTVYLKGLNMFVLRQIGSKINTAYVSMTMVCLMLFISICTLSAGLGMSSDISKMMKTNAPFDASIVTISSAATDETGTAAAGYKGVNIAKALNKTEVPLDSFAGEYVRTRYYDAGVKIPLTVNENNVVNEVESGTYVLKLSDYNRLLKAEGERPVTLKPGEYAVNYAVTNVAYHEAMEQYMKKNDGVTVGGEALTTNPENLYDHTLEVLLNQDYNVTLIVGDEQVEGLPASRDVLTVNSPAGDVSAFDKSSAAAAAALKEFAGGRGAYVTVQTASDVREQSDSAVTIVSYLAIYLGVIFLITAAAVLAIGQLSEMSDNIERYNMLRKIGTDEKMLNKSILAQNAIYFGAPMLLAAVHSVFGITIISRFVNAFDGGDVVRNSMFVALAFIVIYGGYFLATYHGGKGILNREGAARRIE
jgi:putative ABC transport system permease protein